MVKKFILSKRHPVERIQELLNRENKKSATQKPKTECHHAPTPIRFLSSHRPHQYP